MLKSLVLIVLPVLGVASSADPAVSRTIDTEKSLITVRVFKAGLFSGGQIVPGRQRIQGRMHGDIA